MNAQCEPITEADFVRQITLGNLNNATRLRIVRRLEGKFNKKMNADFCRICGRPCARHDDGNICPTCSED